MLKITNKITTYCVREKIVKQEDVLWFQYSLEKKFTTIIIGIPFFILALVISNLLYAISFFGTYFYIKKYLGGYHAKTIWGCLVLSLLFELLFLGIISHFLHEPISFILLTVCTLAILILAPYNHPNLHLTLEEAKMCHKKSILRLFSILMIIIVSFIAGFDAVSNGCTIGIAMATALLCLGYINDWRKTLWKKT